MTHQQTNIDTYVTTLIDQKGYANETPEIKDAIHKDLKQRLDTFLVTCIVSSLSKEDLASFEKLLETDAAPNQIRQFAADHITDYTTFLTSSLLTFQDAYLSGKGGQPQ